jgi:hypothetical protein
LFPRLAIARLHRRLTVAAGGRFVVNTLPAQPTEFQAFRAEMRRYWSVSGLAVFAGAWGMVTGFALFIVIEEYLARWWIPVGAVILATIAAAIVEWLRGRAEGHAFTRPTMSRALSFFVLLIVFELFIYAFHDLSKDFAEWEHAAHDLFGAFSFRGVLNLVVFVALWVWLAASLGSALAQAVARMPQEKTHAELAAQLGEPLATSLAATHRRQILKESLWIGLKAGLRAGLVTIPLIVLAYAVVVRLGWVTLAPWLTGTEWQLVDGEDWVTYLAALLLVGVLGEAIAERRAGFAFAVVLYVGLHVYDWYTGDEAETLLTFLGQLWQTVLLAINVGAIWITPAVVLGILAPFLRRPSEYPWLWGPLALAASAAAVVLLVIQQQPLLFVVAAALVVLGGVLLLRSGAARIDELWPLIAAAIATLVALVSAVVLNVTPLAMYRSIDAVVIPPALGLTERTYLEPRLKALDAYACPKERMEQYDELLQWTLDFRAPRGFALPNNSEMHDFVEERRDLERAVFEGSLETSCDGSDRSHEERPVTRAMTFSLSTVSSLSFWLTLGLLAAWQGRRVAPQRQNPPGMALPGAHARGE